MCVREREREREKRREALVLPGWRGHHFETGMESFFINEQTQPLHANEEIQSKHVRALAQKLLRVSGGGFLHGHVSQAVANSGSVVRASVVRTGWYRPAWRVLFFSFFSTLEPRVE